MSEKKSRKCSLCQVLGHTKITCPKSQSSLVSPQKRNIKKSKKDPVFIKVINQNLSSPHIIKLKKEDSKNENDIWSKVEVYREKNIFKKTKAQIVDFAEMVKKANQEIVVKEEVKNINNNLKKVQKQSIVEQKQVKKERFEVVKTNVSDIKNKKSYSNYFRSFFNIFQFRKFAYVSVVVLVVLVSSFPALGYIDELKAAESLAVEQGTRAFLSLQSSTVAAFQSNLPYAEVELTNALQAFSEVNSIIEEDYRILLSLAKLLPVVGTKVSSRQSLLIAGNHLALGNTYLIKGVEEAQVDSEMKLTDRFSILQNHLKSAIVQYKEALNHLNKVDLDSIPLEYQKTFNEFKILFGVFIDDMEDLVDLSKTFNIIFGGNSFRRYLVVFQNEHEIRPTGGFMGSFAVMEK